MEESIYIGHIMEQKRKNIYRLEEYNYEMSVGRDFGDQGVLDDSLFFKKYFFF